VAGVAVEDRTVLDPPLRVAPGGRPPRGPRLVSRRVRRRRLIAGCALLAVIAVAMVALLGGSSAPQSGASGPRHRPGANPRLLADWEGDHVPITFVFGGDVHAPEGSVPAVRLAADPATAFGPGAKQLLAHADLSMVNLETALTNGSCPVPQPKQYVFWAPSSIVTALRGAGVSLVTEANNHGEDCGVPGLLEALTIRARTHYTVLGIGRDAKQAFASYQRVIDGEHVGIIAATQVIDADLIDSWSATPTQPGLASAYEVQRLVNAVEAARRVDDTVIVYLHWGIQLDACPDSIQEPLAQLLVRAGADVVVGSHAHVLLGAGYLGSALVSYGLGNFVFYNDPSPTNLSGTLHVTITGRHVDAYRWQPAVIEDELPVPVTGAAAAQVDSRWAAARACTDLTGRPTRPLASPTSERAPVPPWLLRELS